MSEPSYLSVLNIADRLGCSRSFVYGLIASGRLEAHKVGPRKIRVTQSEFDRFIESTKTKNGGNHG